MDQADLILIIGTSLVVAPFKNLPKILQTYDNNATVLMNMEYLNGWEDNNR